MRFHGRPKGPRGRTVLVTTLALLLVLALPLAPVSDGTVHAQASSRAIDVCPGSEPPDKDANGERWGDWTIDCPWNEPVNITLEQFKIHGNVTVMTNSVLRISDGAKFVQMYSTSVRYFFTVHESATLVLEDGSELHTDTLIAKPMSDVTIDSSQLFTSGYMNITSSVLTIVDSYVVNQAPNGGSGRAGGDANLIFDSQTTSFRGSIIYSLGGNGGDGEQVVDGGQGGDSYALVVAGVGVMSAARFNISGGDGGKGMDSIDGTGSSAGDGGNAKLDLRAPGTKDLVMNDLELRVHGGDGGRGGNGAMGQSTPGGDGGAGGMGGQAELDIIGRAIYIEANDVLVRGGPGGRGGTGGESMNDNGGNGGQGARGGNSFVQIHSDGDMEMMDTAFMSVGGHGGVGGFFGQGGATVGQAGDAGNGGRSTMIFEATEGLTSSISSMTAKGGAGGQGGLGSLIAGDGGDGGDAWFELSAETTMNITGGPSMLDEIGAIGGTGGGGGDAVDGGLKGWGGDGGDAFTILGSSASVDLDRTAVRATSGQGGEGGRTGPGGVRKVEVRTTMFNSSNGRSDWAFEGFDSKDRGRLINMTVDAPNVAFVHENETGAQVTASWHISVAFPSAKGDWVLEVWKDEFRKGAMLDQETVTTGAVHTALYLGQTVTSNGTQNHCYAFYAYSLTERIESNPYMICPNRERAISLKLSGNIYPPKVAMSSPVDGEEISSSELAPCRDQTPEEAQAGILPAGCLRILGDAYEDDRDDQGTIDDIMVTLSHEGSGGHVFTTTSNPAVVMLQGNTRRTQWHFDWEIGSYDKTKKSFLWEEGNWTITVRVFDGKYWSDNLLIGGVVTSLTVSVSHDHPPVPPIKLDAGPPSKWEYEYYEDGVLVRFKDAEVLIPEGNKVIRMEWDYDGDGTTDWSYLPTECREGETCKAPETTHFYQRPGFVHAEFCALDEVGILTCDDTTINIQRTAPPPATFGVPNEWLFVVTAFIVCICSVITTALIIASLSEAAKYAIMSLILVPLYTRLKKEEMLDNYSRGEIRGYIVANPGAHYSRIKRDLGLNNGALIYHLRALEREGFIYSHRDDYYRRFYPRGRKPRPGPNLTTVQESIIELLLLEPDRTASELAKELEKSRKVINYHLVWLRRWGLVEAKKDGRRKVYSVIYEDDVEMEEDAPQAEPTGPDGLEGP